MVLWLNDCLKTVLCGQLSLAVVKITDVQGLLCIHWTPPIQSLSSTSSCVVTTASYVACKILTRFFYPGTLHLVAVISRCKSAILSNAAIFSDAAIFLPLSAKLCRNVEIRN